MNNKIFASEETNITAFKFFPTVPSSGGNRSEKENIFKSPEAPQHIAAGLPEATFLVPDWGIESTLAYRGVVPARQAVCSQADRHDNPMPESTISPSQGLRIWPLTSGQ
jgi:hypothetical protein